MKKTIAILGILFIFTTAGAVEGGVNTLQPGSIQVGVGNVCGVGRNKSEAQANMAANLNYNFIKLYSSYSAYSGPKFTGRHLAAPFRPIGEVVFERISLLADYNWTACFLIQGSQPNMR